VLLELQEASRVNTPRGVGILRELIVSGILRPADRLDVGVLSERYELEPSDISDALATLEKEGLITFLVDGPVIRQVSEEETVAWLHKRMSLEPDVAEKLAAQLDNTISAILGRHIDEQRVAVEDGDIVLFLDLTAKFHCDLATLAGFPMAAHFLERARDRMLMTGHKALPDESKLHECFDEHCDIVRSLNERQPAAARASMIRHLELTAKRLDVGEVSGG